MCIFLSLKKTPKIVSALVLNKIGFQIGDEAVLVPLIKEHGVYHVHEVLRHFVAEGNDRKFLIDTSEEGGRHEQNGPLGNATVVGGVSGEKLSPYLIHLAACSVQARFLVPWRYVLAKFDKDLREIFVKECWVKVMPDISFATLEERELWRGGEDYMPPRMKPFVPLVQSLKAKARCTECRCVHFGNLE